MKQAKIRIALSILALAAGFFGCARQVGSGEIGTGSLTDAPVTDALTLPSTSDLTSPPVTVDPSLPQIPPPGVGVYTVGSEAELMAVPEEEEGITLCITEPFVMSGIKRFSRPLTLIYLPEDVPTQAEGCGILIKTEQSGQISVTARTGLLLERGLLTVDAPACSLSFSEEALPSAQALTLFCNVLGSRLGGTGSAEIDGIFLLDPSGKPYTQGEWSVRGNRIILSHSLLASEQMLRDATLLIDTDGEVVQSRFDLTALSTLTVRDEAGRERSWLIEARPLSFSLPLLRLYTEDGSEIDSKTEYERGRLVLDGVSYGARLKGRGNASWSMFPKKAYRIKLDGAQSLLGLTKSKDYLLVSNYADKSLIRNAVASAMGQVMEGLDFTPAHRSVHLYLNGEYMGVYGLAEKIGAEEDKLDLTPDEAQTPSAYPPMEGIGDIGFLCEVGWDFEGENLYGRDYFDTDKILRIYVKEPDIYLRYQDEMRYVMGYLQALERAAARDDGWEDYVDLDSFLDWMIVTELSLNTESVFYRSCYFWKSAGGKLHMGPIWDSDMAFGNHLGDIAPNGGLCTTESIYYEIEENWIDDLIRYPAFTSALKARWNEKKEALMAAATEAIDRESALLADGSAQANFERWDILGEQIGLGAVNPDVYDTYEEQVQYLRDFLAARYAYLDERIGGM